MLIAKNYCIVCKYLEYIWDPCKLQTFFLLVDSLVGFLISMKMYASAHIQYYLKGLIQYWPIKCCIIFILIKNQAKLSADRKSAIVGTFVYY